VRILVCVKWVPLLAALRFDPVTRRLVRDGVPGEVSAFDGRALGCATAVREMHGGEIAVLTMGGPAARAGLLECLALGADRGLHLLDATLVGSDTLATARALAAVVRRERPDLVLLGRASMDAETGQVGPELAELLDWPLATQVRRLAIDAGAHGFEAEREVDDGFETVRGPLPAVVTVAEDIAPERFASKAEREAAAVKPIETVGCDALGLAASEVGTGGSPTWVADVEEVQVARRSERIEADTPEAMAGRLRERLAALGALARGDAEALPALPPPSLRAAAPLWVVAETGPRGLRFVTRELLAKAAELAARLGGAVESVAIGAAAAHSAELAAAGAERVLVADGPGLEPYTVAAHAAVLAEAIRVRRPRLVLLGSTARGRELAPQVAARLGLGLTGDAIDLDVADDGSIRQWKPAFGGSVVAPILSRTRPEMATVRPGLLAAARPDPGRRAVVERLPVPPVASRVRVVGADASASGTADALDGAPLVLGIGMGVGADGVAAVCALTERLGAAVAATRDVTDAGWLPRQHQVGITGRAIAPRLYVALGVRGAVEHVVGLRRAGTIVAVNRSPKAPMHKHADLSLVADLHPLLPYLEAALRARE
jgi:electron transfer flavoprotein alpha subunit